MDFGLPAYLDVPPDQLGRAGLVRFRLCGDMADTAAHMAQAMFDVIATARDEGRQATLIVPVGPVDQFPMLAGMINQQRLDCRDVALINMDEYLTADDRWIDADHPLSFRGYMNRKFYDLIDRRPRPAERKPRVSRSPQRGSDPAIASISEAAWTRASAASASTAISRSTSRPSRARRFRWRSSPPCPRGADLSRETRTINSVTVGGEIAGHSPPRGHRGHEGDPRFAAAAFLLQPALAAGAWCGVSCTARSRPRARPRCCGLTPTLS